MELTDREIQIVFSKYILNESPESCVIRSVLFLGNNNINWQEAFKNAMFFMPELLNERLIKDILHS